MDPFVIIKYNGEVYRTKVVRHDLNPSFNDKFILYVRRQADGAAEPSTVSFDLQDWEQIGTNKGVGSAVLDLDKLIDAAPKPDPETGLYSVEAMRLHAFDEIKLDLDLKEKEKWEGKFASMLTIRYVYSQCIWVVEGVQLIMMLTIGRSMTPTLQ